MPLYKDIFLAYNYRRSREAVFFTLFRDYSSVKKNTVSILVIHTLMSLSALYRLVFFPKFYKHVSCKIRLKLVSLFKYLNFLILYHRFKMQFSISQCLSSSLFNPNYLRK